MITKPLIDVLFSFGKDEKFPSEIKAEVMRTVTGIYQEYCKGKSDKEVAKLNLNSRDAKGNTPLMHCIQNGFTEFAELLMEEKCVDLDAQNHEGYDALRIACTSKQTPIALRLIEKNADVDSKDKDGVSTLITASFKGDVKLVTKLIEYKANITINTPQHGNALFQAVKYSQNPEIVSLLVAAKANLEDKILIQPVLISAVENGHKDICKILIDAKANLNVQTEKQWTALGLAINAGKVEIASLLIEAKADPDLETTIMRAPLTIAAHCGHIGIVKQLIEHKAALNTQYKGVTALMVAVYQQQFDTATYLINAGADLNLADTKGETAFDDAVKFKNLELVTLFLEKNCVIRDPTKLREFLTTQTDPAKASQVAFCFGVLTEQEKKSTDAKKYYEEAIKAHHPESYKRLGDILEREKDFSSAISLYAEGAKQNYAVNIKLLVNVAQKLSNIEEKDADVRFNYRTATAHIYYLLLSTGLHAELTAEQWIILAADAQGNPYFHNQHSLQNIRFSLRAGEKAKEQAKLAYDIAVKKLGIEEKSLAENNAKKAETKEDILKKEKTREKIEKEIAEFTIRMKQTESQIKEADDIISAMWRRYHFKLNSKEDNQNEIQAFDELENVDMHDSWSIVASYADDEALKKELSVEYPSEHYHEYLSHLRKEYEASKNLIIELPKTTEVPKSVLEEKPAVAVGEFLDAKHVSAKPVEVSTLSKQSLFAPAAPRITPSRVCMTLGVLSFLSGAILLGLSGTGLLLIALGMIFTAIGAISLGVGVCLDLNNNERLRV